MNPYPNYKPSGIEWIGDIPSHWELKRLKYVLFDKLKYGANESAEFEEEKDPRYIRITDFGDDGRLRNDTFKSLPIEIAKEYLLKEGDVLFARSGATVGKTFQFKNYQGVACYAGYLIKASPDETQMLSDFLYYFTRSNEYDNWKNSIFNQATIQNIGADKYCLLEIPVPSKSEQSAITSYLDEKTSQIDKLISNKQKLIQLLKEERTAVINEAVSGEGKNWERKKLKYVAKLKSGDGITADDIRPEGEYPVYGGNGLRGYTSAYTHDGDYVLIGRQGALCGNINYAFGKFFASEHAVVVSILDGSELIWLGELLKSMNLNQYSQASAQPGLSVEKIQNLTIPVPPLKEQASIVHHIQAETRRIDATISKIEKEIELMNEYRTALISEVVTGKINVTGNRP